MSAADLVFADGAEVLAQGRLVRDGNDWWLDSRRVLTLAARSSGGRSDLSTRLVGGDAHIKAFQGQDAKAAKAWVHVLGRWQCDTVTVQAVGAGPGRGDQDGARPVATDSPDRRAQLEKVAATFEQRAHEWGVEAWGIDGTDENGVPYAHVELFRVTLELAHWVDQLPVGLVRLDPSVRRRVS